LDRKSEKIPPIKIHNTFSGDTQTIGTVNDRIFIVGSSKRVDHEKVQMRTFHLEVERINETISLG
jgi:hypothetical protein